MPDRPFALADFDFDLPPELIAQHPAAERSASRLLDATGAELADRTFRDLPGLLRAGDLMVFNDTRVVKARLLGRKASGGAVEALFERVAVRGGGTPGAGAAFDTATGGAGVASDPVTSAAGSGAERSTRPVPVEAPCDVLVHLRASKSPRPGSRVVFENAAGEHFEAEVLGRGGADGALFVLRFPGEPFALLERFGHVPLPPYIAHADTADDECRYQTVFARAPGAVAAPTAALHFDAAVLDALAARGVERASVTLHVGAGTFRPVRGEDLSAHVMHSEWFDVPEATVAAVAAARARGGRVLAVGTTTLRALESAALGGSLQAGARDTDIFITPGFAFRVADLLLTNFHLPRSTLLMLVSAFAGHARMRAIYAHAIEERYQFFSYGDAMLLGRV